MSRDLFWIEGKWPGRLAVSPRPRGGDWLEDEMKAWLNNGIDVVVTLLMSDEIEEFELEKERTFCESAGMSFYSFPIADRDVPSSRGDACELGRQLDAELSSGRNVAVHCRQGIGRSGLIVIACLMEKGQRLDDAIALVSKARGRDVPETPEQLAWLRSILPGSSV